MATSNTESNFWSEDRIAGAAMVWLKSEHRGSIESARMAVANLNLGLAKWEEELNSPEGLPIVFTPLNT